jgi:nucleosome binding factor SPN SPT16 subunit
LTFKAWDELSVTTIQKSFRTSGVFNDGKWSMKLPEPPLIEVACSDEESEEVSESEMIEEDNQQSSEEENQEIQQPLTAFDILMSSKSRNKK